MSIAIRARLRPASRETPEKAVYNAAVLEELAKVSFITHGLSPNAARLSDRLIPEHFERKHGQNAYYGQK